MIPDIRLVSQQLATPTFDDPKTLVSWMGAIQAQDYAMSKWAIGIRLKSPSLQAVDEALRKGEILRTHVMRPTWHYVAAEDIRWMLKLSAKRNKATYDSYAKGYDLDIEEHTYAKCNNLIEKILEGRSLTKTELGEELFKNGIETDNQRMTRLISRAEIDGIICSGVDKGKNPTFALLEERAPSCRELEKDESLAKLATNYFSSHSPASLQDFIWWSGLSVSEAKEAIDLISTDLITETYASQSFFIHTTCSNKITEDNELLHLLPSFDEYLISYKDRTAVLKPEHHSKAFNNYGTFYPVILHNGQIVGNWKKSLKKRQVHIETSFFDKKTNIKNNVIKEAEDRYKMFLGSL